MQNGWQDLRRAVRSLWRTPGFTLVALWTLALGIGASTAIFTVVRAVLLRELPFEQPIALVQIGHQRAERGAVYGGFSPQDFDDLRAGASRLSSVSAYFYAPGLGTKNLTGFGEPLNVSAAMVDGRMFSTLGATALRGRTFGPEDDRPGENQVVVLSDAFWRGRLGGDRDVVGKVVRLDGTPYRVIGVMPPAFAFPSAEAQIWLPLSLMTDAEVPHIRPVRWLNVIGRLAPGVTPDAARAQVGDILSGLERRYLESNKGWGVAAMQPLTDFLTGDVRTPLLALLIAVGLVMLIACVNVAHLMLARGLSRTRELAIRAALGASRRRLLGQLLLESAVLALAAAALGLLLAWLGVPFLSSLAAATLPRASEIAIDPVVAGFAVLAGVASFLMVGVLPALRSANPGADTSLREGRGQSSGSGRLASGLLAAESGFAVLLLCGAVLALTSLWKLTHVDPGFRAEGVATMRLTLQGPRFTGPTAFEPFRHALLERIAQVPGVVAVGGSKRTPLTGGGEPYGLEVVRASGAVDTLSPAAGVYMVTPGYFGALSIPLLSGRDFTVADSSRALIPVVASLAFAKQGWPGQDAVGQRFRIGPSEGVIVGVVGDVHHEGLGKPAAPAAYVPLAIFPRSSFNVFAKVRGEPLAIVGALRDAVHQVDPDMPVSDLGRLSSGISASVSQPRLFGMLLGIFGATALLLASLGIYGVVAQGVSRRRREIGIRMALGARATAVVQMIVGGALGATLAGSAIGLLVYLLGARFLRSQLYEVDAADPLMLAFAAAVLLATAWFAAWIPARRAARVDPMAVLRIE
ncbi:MAG: ABC transporter permease [Gemmatimonadota bacterium]